MTGYKIQHVQCCKKKQLYFLINKRNTHRKQQQEKLKKVKSKKSRSFLLRQNYKLFMADFRKSDTPRGLSAICNSR